MPTCDFCGQGFGSNTELHLHWGEEHENELNSHQESKVKKARNAQERQKRQKQQQRKQLRQYGIYAAIALVVIGGLGFAVAETGILTVETDAEPQTTGTSTTGDGMGEQFPIEGAQHHPVGTDLTYNTNPPASGPHWPSPADWGFYNEQLPDEQLVHNLEHGGIWISYTNVSKKTVDQIRSFAEKHPNAVIATPRPENDAPIALASWGRLLKLQEWNATTAEQFLFANLNNAPEPLAGTSQHQ